jgi:hypothetical protein
VAKKRKDRTRLTGLIEKRQKPKKEGILYRIVRLSSRGPEEADSRLAVIASGFTDGADARCTADNWLRRHCPEASYDEESGCWSLDDHDGWKHWFFIEPTNALNAVRPAA